MINGNIETFHEGISSRNDLQFLYGINGSVRFPPVSCYVSLDVGECHRGARLVVGRRECQKTREREKEVGGNKRKEEEKEWEEFFFCTP